MGRSNHVPAPGFPGSAPIGDTSLVQTLWRRARTEPSAPYLRFLVDGEVEGRQERLSVGELASRVRALAQALQTLAPAGSRALILLPPGPAYDVAMFACLAAQIIAVPAYPPDGMRLPRTLPRVRAIAADAEAALVLVDAAVMALKSRCIERAPELAAAAWLDVQSVPLDEGNAFTPPLVHPDDVAYLQYTSGSTATPKGVRILHGNLIANCQDLARILPPTGPASVSWLPPYHDMGLLSSVFLPLFSGQECVVMSPSAFIRRPIRWLRAIHHFRASLSSGPDFALDLVARRVSDRDLDRLDLSCWKVLVDGGEPVRPKTIERFEQRLARAGLVEGLVHPAYGLAEGTLIVTGAHRPRPRRSYSVGGHPRISCGSPAPGTEVIIVDPSSGERVSDPTIGEIWVRGPGVGDGYHGRPVDSQATFGAHTAAGMGPFLRTGDLGALFDGDLVVEGRLKDLIIVRGRNLAPQDVERTVEAAHPAIHPGGVAAFSLHTDNEGVGLVVEVNPGVELPRNLSSRVRAAVFDHHDVAIHTLRFTHRGSLPRTSSGKLQRGLARQRLLQGEFPSVLDDFTGDEARPLYAFDDSTGVERADGRSAAYQFDLEADVRWDLLDAPGDTYPTALIERIGFDVSMLRANPEAWETLQWVAGLTTAMHFRDLELSLVDFVRTHAQELGEHRSLDLLDEEELKHVALFERWVDHAQERRPEAYALWEDVYKSLIPVQARKHPIDRNDALEFHYQYWAFTLFFEEFTLWLYEALRDERSAVQPTWLDMHRVHAREEVQHMRTDRVWLRALDVDEAWREEQAASLARRIEKVWEGPALTIRRVMQRLHPEVVMSFEPAPVGSLVANRSFRHTRSLGAALVDLAAAGDGRQVMVREVRTRPGRRALEAWLRDRIAERAGVSPSEAEAAFVELGLESADRLGLAGELETWLGGHVESVLFFRYSDLRSVVTAVQRDLHTTDRTKMLGEPTKMTATRVGARTTRLLDAWGSDPASMLDHITVVWRLVDAPNDAHLQAAVDQLLVRHAALRSRFVRAAAGDWVREEVDEPRLAVERRQGSLRDVVREVQVEPYDPSRGPLARAVRVDDHLVLGLHHAIADGWSVLALRSDLERALDGATLVPTSLQPEDLAAREPDGAARTAREAFWTERLADHPDLKRPGAPHPTTVREHRVTVAPGRVAAWRSCAENQGVTEFSWLLGALTRCWSRATNSTDVLIGAHLHDRSGGLSDEVLAYQVDILCLRVDLAGCKDLAEANEPAQAAWVTAMEQRLPIADLVDAVAPSRRHSRWIPPRIALNRLPGPTQEPSKVIPERGAVPTWLPTDVVVVVSDTPDGGLELVIQSDSSVRTARTDAQLLDDLLDELDLAAGRGDLHAFAKVLGEPNAVDRTLASLGVDSLDAVELELEAERLLGRTLAVETIDTELTVRQIWHQLRQIGGEKPVEILPAATPSDLLSPVELNLLAQVTSAAERWRYGLLAPVRLVGMAGIAPRRVQALLQALVVRHEALRTSFELDPARRVVHATAVLPLQVVHLDGEDVDGGLVRERDELQRRPWALNRAPLATAKLVLGAGDPVLMLHTHHLISDMWSLSLFGAELGQMLAATDDPTPERSLEPVPHRLSDVARTLSLASRNLHVPEGGPSLPRDGVRRTPINPMGERVIAGVPPDLVQALDEACTRLQIPRSVALLAATEAVFVEHAGGEVAYSFVRNGRWRADLHLVAGYLVGSTPALATQGRGAGLSALLQAARSRVEERPQPGHDVIVPPGEASRIVVNPYPRLPFSTAGTPVQHALDLLPPLAMWDGHDMLWQARPLGEHLVLDVIYRPSVFRKTTIETLAARWLDAVRWVSESP